MTPGRLLWLLRRDLARGPAATWNDYFVANKIVHHRFGAQPASRFGIDVHVLLGRDTWRLTLWMLASWEHFTAQTWPVVLWEDGTLDDDTIGLLARLLPQARLVRKSEATQRVAPLLARHPACAAFRGEHPLAQKTFDIPLLATTERLLLLDSDVLFFAPPAEILAWCRGETSGCWFNADVAEASLVEPAEARATLGVELQPRINSGLCLLERRFLDLELCEHALTTTGIRSGHPWRVEQTLIALCASRAGAHLLPPTYEVSLGRDRRPGAIARHYVGAVRQRFYGEGLRDLHSVLLK